MVIGEQEYNINVTITAPWERPWPTLETDSYIILSSFSGKMDGTLEVAGGDWQWPWMMGVVLLTSVSPSKRHTGTSAIKTQRRNPDRSEKWCIQHSLPSFILRIGGSSQPGPYLGTTSTSPGLASFIERGTGIGLENVHNALPRAAIQAGFMTVTTLVGRQLDLNTRGEHLLLIQTLVLWTISWNTT